MIANVFFGRFFARMDLINLNQHALLKLDYQNCSIELSLGRELEREREEREEHSNNISTSLCTNLSTNINTFSSFWSPRASNDFG